jgi:5-methyltetrahydropteroyltriglutamate--homocysteine methyltransferase
MLAYRADVVGSMLRPAYLMKAREDHAAGRMTDAEFKRLEDRAVDECIAVQERSGVDVVTDGEQRRSVFASTCSSRRPTGFLSSRATASIGTRWTGASWMIR